MKIEDHNRNIKESIEVIRESIQKNINERQRTIGFNASVGAVEMFEVFLHKKNLINPGIILKHNWFNSKNIIKEKLNFDFENKEKILRLLIDIESKRNLLCYGKPQPTDEIKSVINSFNQIKSLFEKEGLKWN